MINKKEIEDNRYFFKLLTMHLVAYYAAGISKAQPRSPACPVMGFIWFQC